MGFQGLRTGAQIYILNKASLNLDVAEVQTVSQPYAKFANAYYQPGAMVVDVTASVAGQVSTFQRLPASAEIADFGENTGIVISCSREAINAEVSAMRQKSVDIVASIDTHRKTIESCDAMLNRLNPEIAEKHRQDAETQALRKQVNELTDMVRALCSVVEPKKQKNNGKDD